jgi:hypothetical protein
MKLHLSTLVNRRQRPKAVALLYLVQGSTTWTGSAMRAVTGGVELVQLPRKASGISRTAAKTFAREREMLGMANHLGLGRYPRSIMSLDRLNFKAALRRRDRVDQARHTRPPGQWISDHFCGALPTAPSSAAAHSLDSPVIAGLDSAIQRLLDAWLKAGHELVNPPSAPQH